MRPAHEPQMAANGSIVALTFGAGHADLLQLVARWRQTFSAPVKVAEARHRPADAAIAARASRFAGNAIVITAVAGNKAEEGAHAHGLPSDGDLGRGVRWTAGRPGRRGKPSTMCPRSATEGLHALAADGKGTALRGLARQARRQGHQALLARVPPMAAPRGRRTSLSINRPTAPSASAAIPRSPSMPRANCW